MIYRFDDFEVNTGEMVLRRAGSIVPLRPRPLALLDFLIANRDRVVPKQEIIDTVWDGRPVSDAALSTAVRDIPQGHWRCLQVCRLDSDILRGAVCAGWSRPMRPTSCRAPLVDAWPAARLCE